MRSSVLQRASSKMLATAPTVVTSVPAHDLSSTSRQRRAAPRLIPPHGFDTHVHVFDPVSFPYAPTRSYSPVAASQDQLDEFTSGLTTDSTPMNAVLVQPSPYGYNNTLLQTCLRRLKTAGRPHRGVAVVDPCKTSETDLLDLHADGVRGIRIVSDRLHPY